MFKVPSVFMGKLGIKPVHLCAAILTFVLLPGLGVASAAQEKPSPDKPVECKADSDSFCVEGDKDKAARLNSQALELSSKQDYDKALDLFKEAINLDKTNPEYHYNLGLTYYYLGKLKEEEAAYLKVLAIEPNDPALNPALSRAYFGLACVYAEQGKKDKAFAQLEKLLIIDPGMLHHSIRDKDLDSLRDDPRFEQFLAKKSEKSGDASESKSENSDESGQFK